MPQESQPIESALQNLQSLSLAPPPDDFLDRLSRLVKETLGQNNWSMTVEEDEVNEEDLSDPNALLPMVLWRASMVLETIWGPHARLKFKHNPNSPMHASLHVTANEKTLPLAVWLHATHYVLEKAVLRPQEKDTLGQGFRIVPNEEGKPTMDLPLSEGKDTIHLPNGRLAGAIDPWVEDWNMALEEQKIVLIQEELAWSWDSPSRGGSSV